MGFAFHYVNNDLYMYIKSSDFFPVLISVSCPLSFLLSPVCFSFISPLLSFDPTSTNVCSALLCAQRRAAHQLRLQSLLRGVLVPQTETGSLLHVACLPSGRAGRRAEVACHRAAGPSPSGGRGALSELMCCRQVLADRLFPHNVSTLVCQSQPPSSSAHRPLWSPHVCSPRLNFLLLGKQAPGPRHEHGDSSQESPISSVPSPFPQDGGTALRKERHESLGQI